jgi:hypothetical protein
MKNAVFAGTLCEIHLAEHSIVLELDNGRKLLIEGEASYCHVGGDCVPLRGVIGRLCGAFITGISETDSGGLSVSIRSGETIYVSAEGFDDGGDGPYTLLT